MDRITDRIVASALAFIAALFPGNRWHRADRPGRHRADCATRPIAIPVPAHVPPHVVAVVPVPHANVMQNSTDL